MMSDRRFEKSNSQIPSKNNSNPLTVSEAQETIYRALLTLVKKERAAVVLSAVKELFIHPDRSTLGAELTTCVNQILLANQEQEFRNTLKRSCYILINNWDIARSYDAIQSLVQLFNEPLPDKPTYSVTKKRLREWLNHFSTSQDFHDLKLFTARYEERSKNHWSRRYTPYLLAHQYSNSKNSEDQRQAAKKLSNRLKDQFKFDLAMYTAYAECPVSEKRSRLNPTGLGDEVLRLIRSIVGRKGYLSYPSLANLFLQQTDQMIYRRFKRSLLKYLFFSSDTSSEIENLRSKLTEKLTDLYSIHSEQVVDEALRLRTTKRIIEALTTEKKGSPSALFNLLMSQRNALTLVVMLLKLVLICPEARTHLEICIGKLVQYYETCPEEECKSVIQFFELFNIVMTIYTENVAYNLVNMDQDDHYSVKTRSEAYRLFSQRREENGDRADAPELLTDIKAK
jgi:hypothetical protein